MVKRVLIVGGGPAGWITAGYLAQRLRAQLPGRVDITLVESADRSPQGIGIQATNLSRDSGNCFKQGTKFIHWRYPPGRGLPDHYVHSFKLPLEYADPCNTLELASAQPHQDVAAGVRSIRDVVDAVNLTEDGSIASVTLRARGELRADLFIDCTGFRAQLIGAALGVPYTSCRSVLLCDSVLTLQVPCEASNDRNSSHTMATAHESGWIWDIGLDSRRSLGNVYSSDHLGDARAEEILRNYLGEPRQGLTTRKIRFEPGYREINWKKNCVAIGLSSGFFEPLEATTMLFTREAVVLLANLFPWGGDLEAAAKQYNRSIRSRYERTLDFIKLHYCISERRDSRFWLDNVDSASIPESLQERLRVWQHRPPGSSDIDENVDLFKESSWQQVLHGMGYESGSRSPPGNSAARARRR